MKKLSKFVIMGVFLLIMLIVGQTNSQAALQANAATHTTQKGYTGTALVKSIREMETAGQTMGLNETVDATTLKSSNSNGIDVHMMKTTEYGAVAILSASGFGNPKKLSETTIKSSTGNVTGVYIGDRWEWTAGVCDKSALGIEVDTRYYDLYTSNDKMSAKVGDALGLDTYADNPGCSGWHGSGYAFWFDNKSYGLTRGGGTMFAFYAMDYNNAAWAVGANCGRGVAVVGQDL